MRGPRRLALRKWRGLTAKPTGNIAMPLRFADPAPEAYHAPLVIRHPLDGVLTKAGDQQIVYRDQAAFTYRQFVDRIGRLASLLEELGTAQGLIVALMAWDRHRLLEVSISVHKLGTVRQHVNVRLPPHTIHNHQHT